MRSKSTPTYVEILCRGRRIFRGLFYSGRHGIFVDVEENGDRVDSAGPFKDLGQAYDYLKNCANKRDELLKNVDQSISVASLKAKGAQLFVAKESGRWSIIAGMPNGKFVDSNLRFDAKSEAEEALKS